MAFCSLRVFFCSLSFSFLLYPLPGLPLNRSLFLLCLLLLKCIPRLLHSFPSASMARWLVHSAPLLSRFISLPRFWLLLMAELFCPVVLIALRLSVHHSTGLGGAVPIFQNDYKFHMGGAGLFSRRFPHKPIPPAVHFLPDRSRGLWVFPLSSSFLVFSRQLLSFFPVFYSHPRLRLGARFTLPSAVHDTPLVRGALYRCDTVVSLMV